MDSSSPVLEETRSTLDRQIDEIRDQRQQALRILRIYFTAASILIAVITALISTSITLPFELVFGNGSLTAPVIVLLGILFVGRGLITFYGGVFHALEVLSMKSVERHQFLRFVRNTVAFFRGKEFPGRTTYHASLGPDFQKLGGGDDTVRELVEESINSIETNKETIESNNEHLRHMYEKIASGVTGFAIGLMILFLAS